MFHLGDYRLLSTLFEPEAAYAGYKPNVREIPNGDGKVDEGKRYLHIALEYNPPQWALRYLYAAHGAACHVAFELGVAPEMMPDLSASALRVLEYPPDVGSAPHTDFDLLTVNCWRSCANPGLRTGKVAGHRVHLGEIAEMLGHGGAQPHCVDPMYYSQQSIVHFALPRHSAVLPSGATVGEWLKERYARSRA